MDNEVGVYILYLQQADIEFMDDGERAAVTVVQTRASYETQLYDDDGRDLSA